jgi:outer membrane lipoprotein LolB
LKLFRSFACLALALSLVLIAGCAQPTKLKNPYGAEPSFWHGRLSLRVLSDPAQAQAFSAEFELTGSPLEGELIFYTPLGSTAATLSWSAQAAVMRANGEVRSFESLDALIKQAIGTELPVSALFSWVTGETREANGWNVDLSDYARGRIKAKRTEPPPVAELSLILEK